MTLPASIDRRIKLQLLGGVPMRTIAAAFNVSLWAVKRRKRAVRHIAEQRPCGCGRAIGHRGYCGQRPNNVQRA